MKKVNTTGIIIPFICLLTGLACKKDFLAAKTVSNLTVPASLADIQSLLDNTNEMNEAPILGEISADNYYISDSSYKGLVLLDQRAYTWESDIYKGKGSVADWNFPFKQVFNANLVLDVLNTIPVTGSNRYTWCTMKGWALFCRAHAFFQLAQLFAPPYDSVSAQKDLSIPLRLKPVVTEASHRSSVQQTYQQIIADLIEAKSQLQTQPDPAHPNRPSKPAIMALLSRVFLSMRAYQLAADYADSSLSLYNKLLDFNLVGNTFFPFRILNPEILFHCRMSSSNLLAALVAKETIIDSTLYKMYDVTDLRQSLLFSSNITGRPNIRASLTGDIFPFAGITVSELLLTQAECNARAGNLAAAIKNLDTLLRNRYKYGVFPSFPVTTKEDVLQHVLDERRKETAFRGLRWTDLRRLNKENRNIVLIRMVEGKTITLPPNDLRYTLLIPPDVISLSSMQQNPR